MCCVPPANPSGTVARPYRRSNYDGTGRTRRCDSCCWKSCSVRAVHSPTDTSSSTRRRTSSRSHWRTCRTGTNMHIRVDVIPIVARRHLTPQRRYETTSRSFGTCGHRNRPGCANGTSSSSSSPFRHVQNVHPVSAPLASSPGRQPGGAAEGLGIAHNWIRTS